MTSTLAIVAGPGTAARFGDVCIWTAPEASDALVAFLVESARNVSASPLGGARIADHVGRVLSSRDPEPGVGFAVAGPGDAGLEILLHGAVQAWDGSQWLVPQPRPGWLRARIPASTVTVGAHGATAAVPVRGSDLHGGVIPAGGFSLSPGTGIAAAPGPPTGVPITAPLPAVAGPTPPPERLATSSASTVIDSDELRDALRQVREGRPDPGSGDQDAGEAADMTSVLAASAPIEVVSAPPGTIDLAADIRRPPPLPPVGAFDPADVSAAVVSGVRCAEGHFNHQAVTACVTCGRPVTPGAGQTSGPRPSLGVLIGDDGAVMRLDRSYLVGTAPTTDPSVTGGRARGLVLSGDGVAPIHAEVRLSGWEVSVVDRGSPRPTQVLAPGDSGWRRLDPFVGHVLRPGTHLALGPRVLTFITPWPLERSGGSV